MGVHLSVTMAWEEDLQRQRSQKDQFLAEDSHSPLPPAARSEFDGLDHFPPDEALRFELELQEFDEGESITVETTQDGTQSFRQWGEFEFDVATETVRLTAFKSDPDEDRLWVPFRDETNGESTYPAGRYLDLEGDDQLGEGRWVVDFNRAYSPFCAFNDSYECPLIPRENWLDVPIRAGEKHTQIQVDSGDDVRERHRGLLSTTIHKVKSVFSG
jgi:uncharacterized protein (DUF1684 family)